MNSVAESLGEVGLPMPVEKLASREWDAIVVGGGHNGLTTAAYLARAGKSVLVLERRERLAHGLDRNGAREVTEDVEVVVPTLDQVVQKWRAHELDKLTMGTKKGKTLGKDIRTYELHVKPTLGNLPVTAITREDVRDRKSVV